MTSPLTTPTAKAAEQELNAQLSKTPGNASSPSPVSWVSSLITSIIAWITAVMGAVDYVLRDHQSTITSLDSRLTIIEQIMEDNPSARPAAASQARTTKAAPTPSRSRRSRCAKCHAQGHSANECSSTDPAAVRRRVAQNAKARGSRRSADQSLLQSLATAPRPLLPAIDLLRSPPDNQVAFMVAESAELRRRQAQSRRDRNRARKGKTKEAAPSN